MHAVRHTRHRPVRGRRGGRPAVWPAGVLVGRGGRTRVAHRRAGGQHDERRDAGEVGEQQSRSRAAGQEVVPGAGLQRARRLMKIVTVYAAT